MEKLCSRVYSERSEFYKKFRDMLGEKALNIFLEAKKN
jgi:hypothetical protein